jgi:uncharacterized protein (TIRG00374 family)
VIPTKILFVWSPVDRPSAETLNPNVGPLITLAAEGDGDGVCSGTPSIGVSAPGISKILPDLEATCVFVVLDFIVLGVALALLELRKFCDSTNATTGIIVITTKKLAKMIVRTLVGLISYFKYTTNQPRLFTKIANCLFLRYSIQMSKSNLIKILINSSIGGILIFVWLKLVNLEDILHTLREADFKLLLLLVLTFLGATILRAWRLQILLRQYPLRLKKLVSLNFLSQFLSFIIPIRAGEIAKSIYLHTHVDIPLNRVVIWILIDRFLDFWTVLLLLLVTFPLINLALPIEVYWVIISAFLGFTFAAIVILISASRARKLLEKFIFVFYFNRIKQIILKIADQIIDGFSLVRQNITDLPRLICITIFALSLEALAWWIVFYSLGIKIAPLDTLFTSLLSMLTFIVPSAPGYIGSAEGYGLAVFGGVLGLDPNVASAGVVLYHLVTIVLLPAFGIYGLYSLKFNLKLVWAKLRREK